MAERSLFGPLLRFVADYYELMEEQDKNLFLWVWDQWMRAAADVRQHLGETDAAKSIHTIQAFDRRLNMAFVFDPENAPYRRGLARGLLTHTNFPEAGTNVLYWGINHEAFADVRAGDTLVFESGAENHPDVFHVRDVVTGGIETEEVFRPEPGDAVVYRIDRGELPTTKLIGAVEVYPIDETFRSIPLLSTTVGPSGKTLVEGADFSLADGHIGFFSATPRQHHDGLSFFFAPDVVADDDLPFKVFGYPIGFRRPSSEEYIRGLQALYFALWCGPAKFNMETGLSVILGLPFSTPGVVTALEKTSSGWNVTIEGDRGPYSYSIPAPFVPNVVRGQRVGFQALSNMARVIDYVSNPEFIEFIGLQPRLDKFHTFFALINYEVLTHLSGADLPAAVEFLDRARDARTNFQLLIELPVRERLRLIPDAPKIDTLIRGHAMVGPNWANRMRINAFASPGLAHPYGYRTNYEEVLDVSGTVVSFRDSADELVVDHTGNEIPETDALAGKFSLSFDCSLLISGPISNGVWDGSDTILFAKVSFPDWQRVRTGDVLLTGGSAIPLNTEAFTIEEVSEQGLTFSLKFDRSTAAEDGLTFVVRRFYTVKANKKGPPHTFTVEPATLAADGLIPGGSFSLWRHLNAGVSMVEDYEAAADTGRYDFTTWAGRRAALVGCDAIGLDDRVLIKTIAEDGTETVAYDERNELGDPQDTVP